MEFTQIRRIPNEAFAGAPHVTIVNMVGNLFTNFDIDAFRGLGHLEKILSRNNSIATFPNLTHVGSTLKIANFARNKMTDFNQSEFTNMTALTDLMLEGNKFSPNIVPIIVQGSPNLKKLSFKDMFFASLNVSYLAGLDQLLFLDISGCGLTEIPTFPELPKLKIVRLNNNLITSITSAPFVMLPIISALFFQSSTNINLIPDMTAMTSLRTLNMSKTGITDLDLANFRMLRFAYIRQTQIRIMPNISFSKMINFDISNNSLTEIPREKVTNLTTAEKLVFDFNRLSNFPFDIILNSPVLILLSLVGNNFQTIPDLSSYETTRTSPLHIEMFGNPTECDHRIAWLKNFDSSNMKITFSETPCVYPPNLVDVHWDQISISDLIPGGKKHLINKYVARDDHD